MPFIPVPNTIQAELTYNFSGQVVQNVLHYNKPAPLAAGDMDDVGAELVSWFDTTLKANMPATITLFEVKLTDLTTAQGEVINYQTGLPIQGTDVATALPNNCALVITKRTAKRGRSFRGRIYHPALPRDQVTDNVVAAGLVTTLTSAYGLITSIPILSGGSVSLVVVSRIQNGVPLVEGEVTQVTALTSDGIVDTQRRRLPGVGI